MAGREVRISFEGEGVEGMNILALDFATITGWAHSAGLSGVWDFRIKKDESSGMRLVRFQAKLREVLKAYDTELIVFEAVSVGSGGKGKKANMDGVKLQSKMQAMIETLVEETEGLEHRSYNLSEIKAFAIPQKGRKRDKTAMLDAARERWPDVDVIDDNHADALWLLELCKSDLGIG